jgi:protein-S-isoprenylcysteine O-methyltransferase Ste14
VFAVQDLLRRLREDVANLIRTEIELAKSEVQAKLKVHARGVALIALAAAFLLLGLFALVGAAIFALALELSYWASALIVGGVLLLIALLLAWLGQRAIKRTGIPTPDAAVAEALATVEMVKEEVP